MLDLTINFAYVLPDDTQTEQLDAADEPDGRGQGGPSRDGMSHQPHNILHFLQIISDFW